MSETFFITTAIDYTNGPPHIGHAYEKVLADVIARYHKLKSERVFFLTGVDQHGQKVQQSAEKQGVAPQQFVDDITKKFVALWDKFDVRYDRWAATTDPIHKKCVQNILQRLFNEGKLYKDRQGGYYSVRQEQFLTDKERDENGGFGEYWQPVEFREEENYYFKLAEHKDWLLDFIDKRSGKNLGQNLQNEQDFAAAAASDENQNSENSANSVRSDRPFVIPEFRVSELRNAVEKLTGDLCVSRPRARLAWGIEFPFDPEFVTYVWFDALVNYISFAGYDPLSTLDSQPSTFLWPALHVIGKDIMIPAHGVYWPIMLHALGFSDEEMPTLLVHGWWNIAGAKMSKSTGNSVDPDVLADKYGAEALRYYLMSDIATGKDADFSEERLVLRYNTDLANSIGNLLNRTLNMAQKYREGILRQAFDHNETKRRIVAGEQLKQMAQSRLGTDEFYAEMKSLNFQLSIPYRINAYINEMGTFGAEMAQGSINEGINVPEKIARDCNSFIELTSPWKLAKDPTMSDGLDAVLYHLAESLRIIAILISPVLPKAAIGIFDQLDPEQKLSRDFRLEDTRWGVLEDGHIVGQPVPLFPRIEVPPA